MSLYSEYLYREIIRIRHHDHLNMALTNYLHNYLTFSTQNQNITKLASEDVKFLLALKATELCTHPENGPYFTKAQIQTFARNYGIATPNRVSAIIDLAIRSGYLTIQETKQDRRKNPLVPTEQFQKCIASSAALHLTPLSILFGERYADINCEISDTARLAIDIYFEATIFHGQRTMAKLFVQRDAGYVILVKLLLVSKIFTEQPSSIIALPFARVSRAFGVSRAHVQKLFQLAERAGLISIRAIGGKEIEIRPRLIKISRSIIIVAIATAKTAIDLSLTQPSVNMIKQYN